MRSWVCLIFINRSDWEKDKAIGLYRPRLFLGNLTDDDYSLGNEAEDNIGIYTKERFKMNGAELLSNLRPLVKIVQ